MSTLPPDEALTVSTFINVLEQLRDEGKGHYCIDIPDEFNGGWMSISSENIVTYDKHHSISIDFSKTYEE